MLIWLQIYDNHMNILLKDVIEEITTESVDEKTQEVHKDVRFRKLPPID